MKKYISHMDQFIKKSLHEEEILIKDLINEIIAFKKWIITVAVTVFALGLVYIFTSSDEYTTTSKLLMEQSNGINSKALGGLASISGLGNLGIGNQNTEALPPELIPDLVLESDFLKRLMYEKVYYEEAGDSITLLQFVNEYEKHNFYYHLVRFPGKLKSVFSSSSVETDVDLNAEKNHEEEAILAFDPKERKTIAQLRTRIDVEKEERLLVIQTKMPEPLASAQFNEILSRFLKAYLTKIILDKDVQNFEFIKERSNEAKNRVEQTQMKLANFRDSNRGINSQLLKTEEDRLLADFNLEFSLYNSLAQQMEQARIKVQNATPLMTVFQKPQLPTSPSEPKIVLLSIVFLILGGIIGLLFFFGLLVLRMLTIHFTNV
ncbi:Wzz/FepE/Etk N-terminal domain-containing protein [uncultured Cyclobacterium sp.]|uniref:Wzz/FepE/Etk N-terminal domain-containing protein n=1 Tax=uncultured Cyclobacterium sp. TaxID=453820 RepID=UPI0030EB93FB